MIAGIGLEICRSGRRAGRAIGTRGIRIRRLPALRCLKILQERLQRRGVICSERISALTERIGCLPIARSQSGFLCRRSVGRVGAREKPAYIVKNTDDTALLFERGARFALPTEVKVTKPQRRTRHW